MGHFPHHSTQFFQVLMSLREAEWVNTWRCASRDYLEMCSERVWRCRILPVIAESPVVTAAVVRCPHSASANVKGQAPEGSRKSVAVCLQLFPLKGRCPLFLFDPEHSKQMGAIKTGKCLGFFPCKLHRVNSLFDVNYQNSQ